LGMSKPNTAIYQRVEAECGMAQDVLLFTDDRPENIAAARERGWQTHLFDGPDGWAARLVREGLLTPEAAQ
jgi:2-haloacid dehalogenase